MKQITAIVLIISLLFMGVMLPAEWFRSDSFGNGIGICSVQAETVPEEVSLDDINEPQMDSALFDARYYLECDYLPHLFYNYRESVIELLLSETNFVYDSFQDITGTPNITNPYTPDQFIVDTTSIDENTAFSVLYLPEPEVEPLCYFIYIIFDTSDPSHAQMYSIERGGDFFGTEDVFLCSWAGDGKHLNYGICKSDDPYGLETCIELYRSTDWK